MKINSAGLLREHYEDKHINMHAKLLIVRPGQTKKETRYLSTSFVFTFTGKEIS